MLVQPVAMIIMLLADCSYKHPTVGAACNWDEAPSTHAPVGVHITENHRGSGSPPAAVPFIRQAAGKSCSLSEPSGTPLFSGLAAQARDLYNKAATHLPPGTPHK